MKEYQCDICEKDFKTKITLKNHYNLHHNNSGVSYHGNVCTKSFKSQNYLLTHRKSFHGGKNYICKSCGKSFSQEGIESSY